MLVYLAMMFTTFEILSILFNHFFKTVTVLGIQFPLNISVVFFCLGFFILDLATELYDNKVTNCFIYGKILSQMLFITLGLLGISGADLQNTQLEQIINTTPYTILYSIIASIIGYQITAQLMQKLKIYYQGHYLMLRYLLSTLPGEIVFSLIFSFLSFAHNQITPEYFRIFMSLVLVKLILSIIFSILITPITNVIKHYQRPTETLDDFMPFK